MGPGRNGLERADRTQAAQARTRGCCQGLGTGMGQGGQEGRLEKAHATARIRAFSSQVGGGEDLLLALTEQEDEPMDYERLPETGETFIYVAMSRLMLRHLARS